MKRWFRRFLAYLIYLRKPLLHFLPLFSVLVVLLFIGSICFHHLYEQEDLTYLEALYITYCLVFMEHLIDFPKHWVLQLFYFVLPPLGLVVILDGLVRFGYQMLRRDRHAADWVRAMAKTHNGHVVLCGLGRVGLRVLQQLLRLGEEVAVLEKNPSNPNIAYAQKHDVPVLIGTGREEGVLADLNVQRAKSIIVATDDDLANLEIAMDARKLQPEIRVVLRMFDQELASKIRDAFEIELAFSTAALAAPLFATSSSDRSIMNSFYIGDQLYVVAELTISSDSELAGKKIRDLGAELRVFILSHRRGSDETHFPAADTTFEPGDQLVIQAAPATLKQLHQWNRDPQ